MNNVQLMEVRYATNDMLEEATSLEFIYFVAIDDVIEQLALLNVLHDEEEVLRSLNNFVQLDDARVPDQLKNVDLARNSLDVCNIDDLLLYQNFDCNFLAC
jgi:hypothetical protein